MITDHATRSTVKRARAVTPAPAHAVGHANHSDGSIINFGNERMAHHRDTQVR